MALLSEALIRGAKPRDRAYKLFDERGLFLLVMPTGSRLWRLRYEMGRREKSISLGSYPDVPLKRAREKRDEARRLLADEVDPSADRKARRAALRVTFEGVALRCAMSMLVVRIENEPLGRARTFALSDLGTSDLARRAGSRIQ
ncbi:MAG: DUF4102 domain-containing protein [Proteobacteria bacterium]|nr:DUF4102 domain-containing protein [Pseudomonadota bacterium]